MTFYIKYVMSGRITCKVWSCAQMGSFWLNYWKIKGAWTFNTRGLHLACVLPDQLRGVSYVNGVFSSVALEGNKNGGKKGEGGGDGDRQNGLKAVCVFPLASYRFEFRRIAGDACFALWRFKLQLSDCLSERLSILELFPFASSPLCQQLSVFLRRGFCFNILDFVSLVSPISLHLFGKKKRIFILCTCIKRFDFEEVKVRFRWRLNFQQWEWLF